MLRFIGLSLALMFAAPAAAQVGPVPPPENETSVAAPAESAPAGDAAAPAPAAAPAAQPVVAPAATAAATPTTTATAGNGMAARSAEGFDLQLEGGVGLALQGDLEDELFARARIGGLMVREPLILALGIIGEVGGLSELGIGAQLDIIHLWSGFSLELGAVYARGGGAVVHASVGYQIFGVEWQHHTRDDVPSSDALFAKIRVPLGVIFLLM